MFNEPTIEEIIEGLDLFYDVRESSWNPQIIEGIQKVLYEVNNPIKVPIRSSNSLRQIRGMKLEFVREGASYQSLQDFVNETVKRCKSIPAGIVRKTLYNLTDYYLNEDEMARDIYAIATKDNMSSSDIGHYLSKFEELYRKRNLINVIERSYAYSSTTTVAVYPIGVHTEMMQMIETLLLAEDAIDNSTLENMVCSLHTRTPGHMGDALSTLCVRYLKTLVRESSQIPDDRVKVFNHACGKMDKEISLLSMTSPIGVAAREFEDIKVQNDIQLLNITAEAFGSDFLISIRENHNDPDSLIGDVHHILKGVDIGKCIRRYGNLTTEIEPSDVFKLSHSKRITNLCSVDYDNGTTIHLNADIHLNLELVCKDLVTSDIILFSLMDEGTINQASLQLFKTSNDKEARCPTLPITRLKFKSPDLITYGTESINSVIEGLKFSEDGGIKLTYTPKKSYMDEYAQAHKIIHENFKAGNFEAMKTDLAFLFAFINHIESQIMYSKSASTSKREDAMKARMFAINDFKTYLKKVQQHEPGFDFTRYFESLDHSKVLVEFTNSEIKGIRKLLRTILM